MKRTLLLLCCLGPWALAALDGTVKNTAGAPVPEMVVSDGFSFAKTTIDGKFTLPDNPKATTVHLITGNGWTTPDFYRLIAPGAQYAFTVAAQPVTESNKVKILMIGDPETTNPAYKSDLAGIIQSIPDIDFLLIAGDIHSRSGMAAHAAAFGDGAFPRPAYYVIGNHDINELKEGETDPFLEYCAPYWYAFQQGGMLFVAAPMYWCYSADLQYRMEDFGDYLQQLGTLYPNVPKVLMVHDLPDIVGTRIASNDGTTSYEDAGIVGCLYGHKHMDVVKDYDSGRKALAVACPNKGGCGGFAPSYRLVEYRDGQLTDSAIYPMQADRMLRGTIARDGSIAVMACDSADRPVKIVAQMPGSGKAVSLKTTGAISYQAKLEAPEPVRLLASGRNGTMWGTALAPEPTLRWTASTGERAAMADLRFDDGMLFAAMIDDGMGKNGGIVAYDPALGKELWRRTTGQSIRNNFVVADGMVVAIDAAGDIYGINRLNGELLWKNEADRTILSPSSSGVAVNDGMVVGGYGALLRGIDGKSGETRWTNSEWVERTPGTDKLTCFNDMVLVVSQLNGLYGHNAKTGAVQWKFPEPFLAGTPVVDGKTVYVKNETTLFALDVETGKVVASTSLPGAVSAAPPVVWDDLLLAGTAKFGLIALDKKTLEEKWRYLPDAALFATANYAEPGWATVECAPVPDGDVVYIGASDGMVAGLNRDGKVLKRYQVCAPVLGAPVVTGDSLYVLDMAGWLYAFDKETK